MTSSDILNCETNYRVKNARCAEGAPGVQCEGLQWAAMRCP